MASRKRSVKKNNQLEGKKLSYNASEQQKYSSEVRKLVDELTAKTEKEIIKLFESKDADKYFEAYAQDASLSNQLSILMSRLYKVFGQLFEEKGEKIATSMVNKTNKYSAVSLKSSLKNIDEEFEIDQKRMSPVLREILKASVKENVALITSIQSDYLSDVEKMMNRAITTGKGLKDIREDFRNRKGITERHAKNMSLDQTRKVYNNVNAERMKTSGIESFVWLHSGGGQHPREDHVRMNGKTYRFDDPPVIDKNTGERGIPGQAINCKCTMKPVIDFGD